MSKGFIATIIVIAVLVVGGLVYWYSTQGPVPYSPALGGASPAGAAPVGAVSPGTPSAGLPATGGTPAAPAAPAPSGFGY